MQNKYFGDIHDFYKYLLLKEITKDYKLGIHWCLKPDEMDKKDGEKLLTDKEKRLDPFLYDILTKYKSQNVMKIDAYFSKNHSHKVKYFSMLHEDPTNSLHYENMAFEALRTCEIIFFDPDNGIEVASINNKNKYKYISYNLLKKFWEYGKSLIIYQHNDRIPNSLDNKVEKLYDLLGQKPNINIIKKGHVNFIILINSDHQIGHYMVLDEICNLRDKYKEFQITNWRETGNII